MATQCYQETIVSRATVMATQTPTKWTPVIVSVDAVTNAGETRRVSTVSGARKDSMARQRTLIAKVAHCL